LPASGFLKGLFAVLVYRSKVFGSLSLLIIFSYSDAQSRPVLGTPYLETNRGMAASATKPSKEPRSACDAGG